VIIQGTILKEIKATLLNEQLFPVSNGAVAVRLRPLNNKDMNVTNSKLSRFVRLPKQQNGRAWEYSSTTMEETGVHPVLGKSYFSFDHIFREDSSTDSVYMSVVRPVVQGLTNGKHGTVFCYGQTGSGKTHTMQGNDEDVYESDGILQLSVKDVFQLIEQSNDNYIVKISYFEIHNEQVRDLLSGVVEDDYTDSGSQKTSPGQSLTVRSDPRDGIQVGCRQLEVCSVNRTFELLQYGNRNRQVSATGMNQRSSRSHGIFRISIETKPSNFTVRVATLNLVDLAGSENSYASATSDLQQREGANINKSLLSLSKVINALSMPLATRPKFIGYRDSKLTFILQPHLSGNALMAIICNVSPAHTFLEETRSTLRFASRAKLIETQPLINEIKAEENGSSHELIAELDSMKAALNVMKERSAKSEKAYHKASLELKSLKQLMFGEDFESDVFANLSSMQPQSITSDFHATSSLEETTYSKATLTKQMNTAVITPVGNRREGSNVSETLPTEVIILSNEFKDRRQAPYNYIENSETKSRLLYDQHLQPHDDAIFEETIENMKNDLNNARNAVRLLVRKNILLSKKVEKYREKAENAESDESCRLRAQYILLKWSIYLCMLFFILGFHHLFMVLVMFLWLSLEVFTS
jgi:centromeric protein E